jgi:hypothetical protein
MRTIAVVALIAYYGGWVAHADALQWAYGAQEAVLQQSDGSWAVDGTTRTMAGLVHSFYSERVQTILRWATFIIGACVLLELCSRLVILHTHLLAPARTVSTTYRVRTLSPTNRVDFPTLDPADCWKALIGGLSAAAPGAVAFTLSRTANRPTTLGMHIRVKPALTQTPRSARPAITTSRATVRRAGPVLRSYQRRPITPLRPTVTARAETLPARQLVRVIESVLKRYDETVIIDQVPDPLVAAMEPGACLLTHTYCLRSSPHWPLLTTTDMVSDTMRALARAISVTDGLLYHELQLVLTPLRTSTSKRWYQRGRWYHQRLKQSSGPLQTTNDVTALNTKLNDRHVVLTIRVVIIAKSADHAAEARQVLEIVTATLQSLTARYRIPPIRTVQQQLEPLPASQPLALPADRTPPFLPRMLVIGGVVSSSMVIIALLALSVAFFAGQWAQWRDLPVTVQMLLSGLGLVQLGIAGVQAAWAARAFRSWYHLGRFPLPTMGDEPWLLPWRSWPEPSVLSSGEAGQFWHLPDKQARTEFAWVPNRQLPTPQTMFVPSGATDWLTLGFAPTSGGELAAVGLPIKALHQMMHVTAGMGAGKSQAAAAMCHQLIPHGFIVIDGKGDDEGGGLAAVVRRYIPVAEEHRLFYVDVLDTAFPTSLNPIYHMMVAMERATTKAEKDDRFNEALGMLLGLFQRLDPKLWSTSPGMQQYALFGCTLVLRTGSAEPGSIPTMARVKRALEDEAFRVTLLERYPTRHDDVFRFWTEREPQMPDTQKTSLSALLRRLDQFLINPITRSMLSIEQPSVDLLSAMDDGQIILVPIPHRKLGGLAPLVCMLVTQSVVAAAYARKGTATSRVTAPVFIDEVQVLIVDGQSPDLDQAFTQLRGFAVPLLIFHQTLAQLGELEETVRINAANRVILRTGEPDASTYARMYADKQLRAEDILGMPALHQQYAVTLGSEREVQMASIVPMPWPALPPVEVPPYHGRLRWQEINLPTPRGATVEERDLCFLADHHMSMLLYTPWAHHDYVRIVGQLAQLPESAWVTLLDRAARLRALHRQYILDNPGCITDQIERQTWLTRLAASRTGLIEDALFLREERKHGAGGAKSGVPQRTDRVAQSQGVHSAQGGVVAVANPGVAVADTAMLGENRMHDPGFQRGFRTGALPDERGGSKKNV